MKECRICNITKSFIEFYKAKFCKDGYRGECIECNKKLYRKPYKNRKYILSEVQKETKKNYMLNRRRVDPAFKLKTNLSRAFNRILKKRSNNRRDRTLTILGCSSEFFKKYLESKFEDWMTWDNYGKFNNQINTGWDLDHIIPISSAKTIEEIEMLSHYSNFQPLCSYKNRLIKRNKNVIQLLS
jgi:hypothetical protein